MEILLMCAIHRIPFLHNKAKYILYNMNLSENEFLEFDSDQLRILGLCSNRQGKNYNPQQTLEQAKKDCESLQRPGFYFVPFWTSKYPNMLRHIYDPPFGIYVRCLHFTPQYFHDMPMIAMVGTRSPSTVGSHTAEAVSRDLAMENISIVSGLARGIDSEAHKGALQSARKGKGRTLAVLAHGTDFVYPRSHSRLASEILSTGGALLSEFPPRTTPLPYRFPQRNRIISGVSLAVVLVEAPDKSGALITADFALEQGRDLIVLNSSQDSALLSSRRNDGSRLLAEMGAPVISSAEGIIRYVFSDPSSRPPLEPSETILGQGVQLSSTSDSKPEEAT